MKQSIRWEADSLFIIDQRKLPHNEVQLELSSLSESIEAIKTLAVRGAPAIGITAAYGVVVALRSSELRFEEIKRQLTASRPTAVNLFWALDRMEVCYKKNSNETKEKLIERLLAEAKAIHEEDRKMCHAMGENSNQVIPNNANIITICNTGFLATGGIGTALSGVIKAHESGKNVHVYVTETRPLLQGSRLTAWELSELNIPSTLITDNMAAHVMKTKKIDLVLAGADRIAANGDTANKIGTYSLALLAKAHKIPFYIVAPSSSFDFNSETGKDIKIEERATEEVKMIQEKAIAPQTINVYNPAFDVTPFSLITSIITEQDKTVTM